VIQGSPYTEKLKEGFFGLKKRRVYKYIKDLNDKQDEELENIYMMINSDLQERKKLLLKITSYMNQVTQTEQMTAVTKWEETPITKQEVAEEKVIEKLHQSHEDVTVRLRDDIIEQLKKELISGYGEPWIIELRERLEQILMNQQIRERDFRSMPVPEHKGLIQNDMVIQQRLTIDASSFWEEDIENLLFPQQQWNTIVQENSNSSEMHTKVMMDVKTKKSLALENHAYDLRRKYIVGKIVGEQIRDNRGNSIATKGKVITDEILKKVEAEGKLTELIVNMIAQGLGD